MRATAFPTAALLASLLMSGPALAQPPADTARTTPPAPSDAGSATTPAPAAATDTATPPSPATTPPAAAPANTATGAPTQPPPPEKEKAGSALRLSRGGVVARATQQNPQVAAARAQAAQAEARRGQVSAARYPSVNVTLGVGPSLQAELVPGTALQSTRNAYGDVRFRDLSLFFGGQLTVIQPLFTFGKIDERDEATQHEVRARKAQAEMTQADIAFQAADLYETLLFARDSELFLDEMLHGLNRTLERTEAEVEAERMTEGDLLRLQTAIGFLDLVHHQASAGVIQATAGLVAYLGLPKDTPIQTKDEHLELLPVGTLDDKKLLSLALMHRPELRALQAGQAAFQHLADAEEAGNLPDFFVMAFATGAYTPGRDWVDTRFAIDPLNHFVPGGMLGVRWQFQGNMASQRAEEIRAQALELSHMERWAVVAVPAEITKAVEDIRRTRADVDSTQVAVSRAKKWMIQASADFSIGLGSSQDVEDASAAYVQLRLANFRARYQYNVAVASLSKATGLLTSRDDSTNLYPTQD